MNLIIGLGNHGKEYEKTRHNMGFMVVDELHRKIGFEDFKEEKKFKAMVATGIYQGGKFILAKPLTYMNLSGETASALTRFYKVAPENCLIVYDDIDLPLGTLRIRPNGSPGTHNGMKSIVESLGENFPRLRIGIESREITAPAQQDTSSFVLSPFQKDEEPFVQKSIQTAVQAIETIYNEGLKKAMNLYNT